MSDLRTDRQAMIAVAVARLICTPVYIALSWTLCHDGTSVADFVTLLIVGALVILFVSLLGWLVAGSGQLDREDRSDGA